MNYLVFICLVAVLIKMAAPQSLRPPQFNYFNRPVAETIIEPGNFLPASPTVISEPPINSLVPFPNVVSEPTTTIITDCSPTICKNLANTIQLMIVCNLLQNTRGNSEIIMQLAAPIINEVMTSATFPCGCLNPIPNVASNLISPSVISPSVVASLPSNIIGPNALPLMPRVVAQASGCPCNNAGPFSPNVPLGGQIPNTNALLNTLMSLLGNVQG